MQKRHQTGRIYLFNPSTPSKRETAYLGSIPCVSPDRPTDRPTNFAKKKVVECELGKLFDRCITQKYAIRTEGNEKGYFKGSTYILKLCIDTEKCLRAEQYIVYSAKNHIESQSKDIVVNCFRNLVV